MEKQAKNGIRSDWKKQLASGGFLSHAAVLLLTTVIYFAARPWWIHFDDAQNIVSVAVWFAAAAGLCFLLYVQKQGKLDARFCLGALIAAGILLRIGYMLYTPFTWRGHDIGEADGYGHYAYIYNLMQGKGLPQSNYNQFYHPPLMHLISAAFCRFLSLFTRETAPYLLVDPAKIIACTASVSILFTTVKLGRYFKLKKSSLLVLTALTAFAPTYLILSSSINNDVLMIALFMGAFYRTLLWKDRPTCSNILAVALCIGLGMMTKLSAGLIAVFTALVFLAVLIDAIRRQANHRPCQVTAGRLIGQYAAFGAVCLPLALWYPVRNLIRFGQSITYVPRISETSQLFCGDVSAAGRFLTLPLHLLADTPYCNPFGDSNLWLYTLRCSVFGEFQYPDQPEIYAYFLLALNFILILISLGAMIYVMAAGKKYGRMKRFAPAFIWLCLMASFVHFNIQYPFGCTMDFRYIVPTLFVGAYYISLGIYDLPSRRDSVFCRILRGMSTVCISLFCFSSVLFYFG